MKYKFEIAFKALGRLVDTAVLELDEAVIAAVDDEWRESFYPLRTPEEIAEHIAHRIWFLRIPLNYMKGFTDQAEDNAQILDRPNLHIWELSARRLDE